MYKYYKEQARHKKIIEQPKKCAYCGKEFTWTSVKPSQKYCCSECREKATWESSHKEIVVEKRKCENCGAEFDWYSNKSNQKYCSDKCLHEATYKRFKLNKNVNDIFFEELRSEIYLKVSEMIGKMNRSGDAFNGRYIDYWKIGDITEKTRDEVLKRDNNQCVICKRRELLQLHHIIKRKDGGNHTADNLVTLCASCHRHIETGDVEYATNKCFKNAKKYYHVNDSDEDLELEYI
jgi:hypothetical protein